MNIGHLEIMARDPHVTAEFYCSLLDVQIETVQHETYIWLATSPIPILLRPGRSEHHDAGYQDSSSAIVIYTSQLEAELARHTMDRHSARCFVILMAHGSSWWIHSGTDPLV
jgi:predicted enzyme related to lactoylglutathione lyase